MASTRAMDVLLKGGRTSLPLPAPPMGGGLVAFTLTIHEKMVSSKASGHSVRKEKKGTSLCKLLCRKCNAHCPDFIEQRCERLASSPFVRNGRRKTNKNPLRKRFYVAGEARKNHKTIPEKTSKGSCCELQSMQAEAAERPVHVVSEMQSTAPARKFRLDDALFYLAPDSIFLSFSEGFPRGRRQGRRVRLREMARRLGASSQPNFKRPRSFGRETLVS